MENFEELLKNNKDAVERFVKYRLPQSDAEDVLQDVYLKAFLKFSTLKKREAFRSWIIEIARNKCADYFREKGRLLETPVELIPEKELGKLEYARYGISEPQYVSETIALLNERERLILDLFFWQELPQEEIARKLNIPVGTVKSRIYKAKQHFKMLYPKSELKGEKIMKKMPEYLPEYKIEKSDGEVFDVKWEELMGWFLVPKLGENLCWGMYDIPSRRCDRIFEMAVVGKAMVHGIEGVEITAKETPFEKGENPVERAFVAQLTDTHCRYLASMRYDGDVKNYITYLDGKEFSDNWGFGENNCGNEVNLKRKGDIARSGKNIVTADKAFLLDVVGRYTVTIGGKSLDTICVMDIETYNGGVASEQFIDKSGRTVLWRRFNRDDWKIDKYGKLWHEMLPESERLTINGKTYVHWYDCVTDHIL